MPKMPRFFKYNCPKCNTYSTDSKTQYVIHIATCKKKPQPR